MRFVIGVLVTLVFAMHGHAHAQSMGYHNEPVNQGELQLTRPSQTLGGSSALDIDVPPLPNPNAYDANKQGMAPSEVPVEKDYKGYAFEPRSRFKKEVIAAKGGREVLEITEDGKIIYAPPAPAAPSAISDIRPDDRRDEVKVALLLPLTGSAATLGKQMQQAAEIALFDMAQVIDNKYFIMMPFDTKGTEIGALEAVEKAVAEDVSLILGPLLSITTRSVSAVAARHDIPVVSFSNEAFEPRQGLFMLGFDLESQIDRVVSFAKQQGVEHYTALLPDNKLGQEMIGVYEHSLETRGATLDRLEWYGFLDDRLSESIERLSYHYKDETLGPLETLKSHALFVLEGGQNLLTIAGRIFDEKMANGHFRLLGTGLWDDPQLERQPLLVGSWFATSPLDLKIDFDKRFQVNFGKNPERMASLAYDGLALAIILSAQEDGFSYENMMNPNGFLGVNGIFRFRNDGTTERGLSVVEMTEGGFRQVDAAPMRFR